MPVYMVADVQVSLGEGSLVTPATEGEGPRTHITTPSTC